MMTERVLIVDDDANVVRGLRRQFRFNFEIDTASSGEEALELIRSEKNYAVVISDMRMPGMDGVELLSHVQELSPQTVRIMLTGNADQDTATRAVNESNIFRLIHKPCPATEIAKAINDAREQFRLVTAERELLEHTLSGSVKMLTDVLSLLDPTTFGNLSELRHPIREICMVLGVRFSWDIEVAAMLADIGVVTLPAGVYERAKRGENISSVEREMVRKLPERTSQLLTNIPRLSAVAAIVLHHQKNFDGSGFPDSLISGEEIPLGARIIRIFRDMTSEQRQGERKSEALARMRQAKGLYDPELFELICTYYSDIEGNTSSAPETLILEVKSLLPGHVVLEPIETKGGIRVVGTGVTLNEVLIERIGNFAKYAGVKEPIYVTKE